MTKLAELEAERDALAKQEHAAWLHMKDEERRLTALWGDLNTRLNKLNKEIEREKLRAEIQAELQAQQQAVVPTSTLTEEVKI